MKYKNSSGSQEIIFGFLLTIFAFLSHVDWLFASDFAKEPTIADFVKLKANLESSTNKLSIASFLSLPAKWAKKACTESKSSAQPAFPEKGDLRCFFVFENSTTVSFNIVEGIGDDHLEFSQSIRIEGREAVVLGFFNLKDTSKIQEVYDSALKPINHRGMNCASCHKPVGLSQVALPDGLAWPLKPIRLNSTVSNTIPRAGQLHPGVLNAHLESLFEFHECSKNSESETCARIDLLLNVSENTELQNPIEQIQNVSRRH